MKTPHKWYYVAPSSIEGTGLGLYTSVDIKKGTLLPGCYAGQYMPSEAYIALIDELDAMAKSMPRSTSRVDDMEEDAFVRHLRRNYGVRLVRHDDAPIQWNLISKGVTDYAFEGEEQSDGVTMVTVLPVYDSVTGKPVYDTVEPDNPFLLMNEPPAVKAVHNRYLDAWQKSRPNVVPVMPSETGSREPALRFRTTENIPALSELFLCYGSMYERPYTINMSFDCGCGKYDDVSGNLDETISRRKYDDQVERHGYVPREFLSRASKNDRRVAKYLDNVTK